MENFEIRLVCWRASAVPLLSGSGVFEERRDDRFSKNTNSNVIFFDCSPAPFLSSLFSILSPSETLACRSIRKLSWSCASQSIGVCYKEWLDGRQSNSCYFHASWSFCRFHGLSFVQGLFLLFCLFYPDS